MVLNRPFCNERFLSTGELLLEIGELARLEVSADILSQDAAAVRPGNAVEITVAAGKPAARLKGRVLRVDPRGFTKISSLGVEQQRVRVIITFAEGERQRLEESGQQLGVGYRVGARIITAAKAEGLIIPRSALFKNNRGDWQVFRLDGSHARLQPVVIGLCNDLQAEISQGLKPGDSVVIAPPAALSDGARVNPQDA